MLIENITDSVKLADAFNSCFHINSFLHGIVFRFPIAFLSIRASTVFLPAVLTMLASRINYVYLGFIICHYIIRPLYSISAGQVSQLHILYMY